MLEWIKKKRNIKGFTLVELVVVIAILGILAALAIPKLTQTRANAEMKTAVADSRTIASAVTMYAAEGKETTESEPTVEQLEDYLTNAAELGKKYTITYAEGEIERITRNPAITIEGVDLSVWTPGSEELVKAN